MKQTTSLFSFFILLMLAACGSPDTKADKSTVTPPVVEYPENVGDIAYDATTDRADFELCKDRILQYYNFSRGPQYNGERPAMLAHFDEHYSPSEQWNGYVTIRFVVNCQGETDRYRMARMDYDHNEQIGKNSTADSLLTAVKAMNGWLPNDIEGEYYPYYQFLTFRIEEGKITSITP